MGRSRARADGGWSLLGPHLPLLQAPGLRPEGTHPAMMPQVPVDPVVPKGNRPPHP